MGEPEIERLLTETGIGVLSLARDGVPYGIPLSFGYDGENRLFFLFAGHSEEGRKMAFAESSDAGSLLVFEVQSEGAWRSAIAEGPFERITPDEWHTAREALANNAYRPDLLTDVDVTHDPRVWALEIERLTGRAMGKA